MHMFTSFFCYHRKFQIKKRRPCRRDSEDKTAKKPLISILNTTNPSFTTETMLRHQIPHEMKHSNHSIQQSPENLHNVAISNRQITTAITEIIRSVSGAPLLTQPVPEEPLKPPSFTGYVQHVKEDEASAESFENSAGQVPSTTVNTQSLCPDTPFFSKETNETQAFEKNVNNTPPPHENLYPPPSANCTGKQSSTPADERGRAPTESPSTTTVDATLKCASNPQHTLSKPVTAEANTFAPTTLAARTVQVPPHRALYHQSAVSNDETSESNTTMPLLPKISLPKPPTPVFTAEFPKAAHRAKMKKKSKRQLFAKTTEAKDDIYLQEAS